MNFTQSRYNSQTFNYFSIQDTKYIPLLEQKLDDIQT